MTSWRMDPALQGRLYGSTDDLQVMVHDGEPRRTQRPPEACWVRVTAVVGAMTTPSAPNLRSLDPRTITFRERPVYRGTLLDQPSRLISVRLHDVVDFVTGPGLPFPVMVNPAYVHERARWVIDPCNACGAEQTLDPMSVMARTRFPEAPPGFFPEQFTARCPCGGMMELANVADALRRRPPPLPVNRPSATRWVWVDVGGERVLGFTYVDPMAGPSAKGAVVGIPPTFDEIRKAVDYPDRTIRDPAAFGAVPISAAEALEMGLPKDPPWMRFFEQSSSAS